MERRPLRWLWASLGLLGLLGCPGEGGLEADPGRPAAWARLEAVSGLVESRPGVSAPWRLAGEGQALEASASLRTGPDGRARVVFQDGRQLTLEPDSQLDLGGAGEQTGLWLTRGEVLVDPMPGPMPGPGREAAGEFRIVFGEAREVVRLQAGQARLRRGAGGELQVRAPEEQQPAGFRLVFSDASDMRIARAGMASLSAEDGGTRVRMLMGEARLTRGGRDTALVQGQDFQLRLGEVRVLQREPLPARLKARKGQVSLRPPGGDRFSPSAQADPVLQPGTALVTRGPVSLSDGAGGELELSPGSQVVFEESFREGPLRAGSLRLEQGRARVRLTRGQDEDARQTLVTPHAQVVASARVAAAELNVIARPDSTRVEVRAGRAEVKTSEQTLALKAGESLTVDAQGKAGPPEREPLPRIVAQEGQHTQVYYDRGLGKVAFALARGEPDEVSTVELASAPGFQKPLLRAQVDTGYLIQPARPGRTYFRVLRPAGEALAPGPVGSLELVPDPMARRRDPAGLTNAVPDTGVQTRVLFQGQAPALTFQWEPVDGAASYRVRVYTEEELESPHLEERAEEPRLKLAPGRLGEGTYYWYQAALDPAGKQLRANQMNKLVLAFDNAGTLMRIDAPRPGERPAGGKLEVRGRAPVGASVSVHGAALVVADDGRFEQVLTGIAPGAVLVFQVRRPGLGPVLYTRHLGR
jgi:ferric-dicitrate binding protein FerR (iron transport regulator)